LSALQKEKSEKSKGGFAEKKCYFEYRGSKPREYSREIRKANFDKKEIELLNDRDSKNN